MEDRNVLVALALVGLGAMGCGSEIGGGRIVFDTINGVPSVMNPNRGTLGDRVPWRLAEHLSVGSEAEYDGKSVIYALDVGIMPDGGVVVLDAGNQRVLRFGSEGEYLGSFGSEGEGPGQFRVPLLLEVADSLIYVVDAAQNRLLAFDQKGEFLSSFALEFDGLVGTSPAFAAGAPDEVYLFAEPAPFMEGARDTGSAVLYRMDAAGAIRDTVLTFPAANWTPIQLPSGRFTFAKPRLMPEPRFSAEAGVIAVNATAGYVIEIRSPSGEPIRRVARMYSHTPVTLEIKDSLLERLSQGPSKLPREALEAVPFAPVVPAIEDVVLDDRGRLWVDVYVPGEPTRLDIFDEEGRFLGPLRLPAPLRLEDVRGDLACGVLSEVSGQAAVTCYRVADGEARTPPAS